MSKYACAADQAIELLKNCNGKLTDIEVADIIALIEKMNYDVNVLKFEKDFMHKVVESKSITTEEWNAACDDFKK